MSDVRRYLLILAIMEYVYDSARRCGETAVEAERQGEGARDWVNSVIQEMHNDKAHRD